LRRQRWLSGYQEFLEKSLTELAKEEDILRKSGFELDDSWEDQDVQKYTLYDTKTNLFSSRHAVLLTRDKLKISDSFDGHNLTSPTFKQGSSSFTLKFNFPDEILADSMDVVLANSDLKVARKTEQDIYPCYSKFSHSVKIKIPKKWPTNQFGNLNAFVNDPSAWLDRTLAVSGDSTSSISPIIPENHSAALEIFPTSSPTYRSISELGLKIGSKLKTSVGVYTSHSSLSDAVAGVNPTVLESSIRIITSNYLLVSLIQKTFCKI
jgi:hypothetical protein